MVLVNSVTIGADPELFLQDASKKFISSINKFGGTKRRPKAIGANCFIQEDNVALEFNIPPASNVDGFLASINYSLGELQERAKRLKLELAVVPVAHFSEDQLDSPQARQFGCEPDFNAWTGLQNNHPACADASLRSAGGHVHVGCIKWMNDHPAVRQTHIAQAMDLFLGVPSLLFDGDSTRRALYGKAGAYRPKEYGLEYRTLSNKWLTSDELKRWVFEQTHAALHFLGFGNSLDTNDGDIIQSCINNSDKKLMYALMEQYGLEAAIH